MTRLANEPTTGFSLPVEQIARLIRRFDRRQKALLIQLVPELRTIRPEAVDIPAEQDALLTYFERKRSDWQECRPLQDNDPFLAGLTVAEFFALPEEEQARLWDQAHAEAWREIQGHEQPVRADALPAR